MSHAKNPIELKGLISEFIYVRGKKNIATHLIRIHLSQNKCILKQYISILDQYDFWYDSWSERGLKSERLTIIFGCLGKTT